MCHPPAGNCLSINRRIPSRTRSCSPKPEIRRARMDREVGSTQEWVSLVQDQPGIEVSCANGESFSFAQCFPEVLSRKSMACDRAPACFSDPCQARITRGVGQNESGSDGEILPLPSSNWLAARRDRPDPITSWSRAPDLVAASERTAHAVASGLYVPPGNIVKPPPSNARLLNSSAQEDASAYPFLWARARISTSYANRSIFASMNKSLATSPVNNLNPHWVSLNSPITSTLTILLNVFPMPCLHHGCFLMMSLNASALDPIPISYSPPARYGISFQSSSIGVDKSASITRMKSPFATRTPVRSACPFPLFFSYRTNLAFGKSVTLLSTIRLVPSELPSSTTMTSYSMPESLI